MPRLLYLLGLLWLSLNLPALGEQPVHVYLRLYDPAGNSRSTTPFDRPMIRNTTPPHRAAHRHRPYPEHARHLGPLPGRATRSARPPSSIATRPP